MRLLWLILFASMGALAEEPIVKVAVTPEVVNVGEPLRLEVKVLVPTWFSGAPVFPSFEVPNAIVRLPPDSSYPTSERVGRDTWSGIIRHYEVFPLLPAEFQIQNQKIRVTFANPGKFEGSSRIVEVPVITFEAQVPVGAETLNPYIAGESFRLERTLSQSTGSYEVGDALVIVERAELTGLPAMFIPPLWMADSLSGISVYPSEPTFVDGDTAIREEKITLVFDTPGSFVLPERRIQWWSTAEGVVREAKIPGQQITVLGSGLGSEPVMAEDGQIQQHHAWLFLMLVPLLLFAAYIYRIRSPVQKTDEQVAFDELLRERDYNALLRWCAVAHPRRELSDLLEIGDNSRLEQAVQLMRRGEPCQAIKNNDLREFRKVLHQDRGGRDSALPGLNPI